MFVLETNPTSKLDKSGNVLIHCSIVVHAEAKLKGGYGGVTHPPPPQLPISQGTGEVCRAKMWNLTRENKIPMKYDTKRCQGYPVCLTLFLRHTVSTRGTSSRHVHSHNVSEPFHISNLILYFAYFSDLECIFLK